ncbi:MAG: TlyA family rRNA (cytidine-2'-O)-methyltransferase [Halobacteriovoraceae bacterium]|nr:TlyA family rRNA (cytidine-2'-O)-methyltransferase [Halobacteriovoraceae bacterium]|tara:strand:- start:149 stop:892 length:744 start_codon:yes stop_codon:yes gene_type:complete
MKERLDQLLVKRGLVSTRSQAAALIKKGVVTINGEVVSKPSLKCLESVEISINQDHIFVGRGAQKMEGAYHDFSLSFEGKIVGDMGASTGGFTEFALLKGASKVYAVDVGHDQLAEVLKNNPKVINLEGTNIREGFSEELFNPLCDILVVDLSFISLNYVLAPMSTALKEGGEFVILVKPQFEVGKNSLGKNGIVKDTKAIEEALERVKNECELNHLIVEKTSLCALKGKTGNQEYFFYGHKIKESQ